MMQPIFNAAPTGADDATPDTNYYDDALRDANRGAVMEDMLDALRAAQTELDMLRWRIAQVDAYGHYMRHAPHPVTFAEWLLRTRRAVQP